MVKRIIYPGTFDPVTHGHLDIVNRTLKLFRTVEILVCENPGKRPLFSLSERAGLIRQSLARPSAVLIRTYRGILVNYVKKGERAIFIRGLRVVSDFEYELQMAMMNRKLNENVETVFLMPNEKYIFLSSALIREIAQYRGKIAKFVPPPVYKALLSKFGKKHV